jgi:CRP-like cAMP-binding protein
MTTAAKKEWLKSVALFSTLSDRELDALATSAASVTVQKHGRLFEEGAPGDCCYVLTAGEARVVLSGDGDSEMLLATIRPRMIVGELALLDGSTETTKPPDSSARTAAGRAARSLSSGSPPSVTTRSSEMAAPEEGGVPRSHALRHARRHASKIRRGLM